MNKTEKKKFDAIALKAFKTFGDKEQREMVVEECSELILGLQKLKRADKIGDAVLINKWFNNFAEEAVDVSIVIHEFYLGDKKFREKFDAYMKAKSTRLDKRVNDYISTNKIIGEIMASHNKKKNTSKSKPKTTVKAVKGKTSKK